MDSVSKSHRPKKFMSMESLWFEEERLATFIEWPVKFISFTALAAEGFYYLRTKDHCACAFCRGIIGAWEEGDTPRGEHKRHFPHCPFVQGKVTGNVPLALGNILRKIPKEPQQDMKKPVVDNKGHDVCGIGKMLPNSVSVTSKKEELSMQSLGFKEYSGPKRKDYLTVEARLRSFAPWPEKVHQKPEELAEAGFYYCGLSDHVRCFHCGNGLRNWEYDDSPWIEHARWYQDCNYVILTKGKDFIDKVQLEKPPFVTTYASESRPRDESSAISRSKSSCSTCSLSEGEIDQLMELHIIREVIEMGFTARAARIALKQKLIQTGLPFFSLDSAIQSILVIMDEETRTTISGCEYITSQAKQMASCNINQTPSEDIPPTGVAVCIGRPEDFPSTILSPLPALERSSPPLRSSTPASHLNTERVQLNSTTEEDVPLFERHSSSDSGRSSGSDSEEVSSEIGIMSEPELLEISEAATSSQSPVVAEEETVSVVLMEAPTIQIYPIPTGRTVSMGEPLERNGDDYLMEADEVIEEAAKLLATPQSSSSSSSSSRISELSHDSGLDKDMEPVTSPNKDFDDGTNFSKAKEADKLAQELEKLKENRTCRVCMDKEMDIVFLPCTHMVTCSACAVALSSCPICRRNIQYAFKPIIT